MNRTLKFILAGVLLVSLPAYFAVKLHEDCRRARVILSQAEAKKMENPTVGKEFLELLPGVFGGQLRETLALSFCRDIKSTYDAVHEQIFVSLAKKSAEEGERYFTAGKFVESLHAFDEAMAYLDGSNRSLPRVRETPLYQAYHKLSDKALVMVKIGDARGFLEQNNPTEALFEFTMAEGIAKDIGFEIPKRDEIFRDIYHGLGKLLQKKER